MRTFLIKAVVATAALGCFATAQADVKPDTISATRAFVDLPAATLQLLTRSMRLDMLDYYTRRDSIAEVMNAMEGLSHLVPPVTPNYVNVQVTPVTNLTVRVLDTPKGQLTMTIYTVGDSLQARDSELRFYDPTLRELRREKFIKLASTEDFLDLHGLDSRSRKELIADVPFPTVMYEMSPEGNEMTATLTVGEFLGEETMKRLEPYLHRKIIYVWDKDRFKLKK